MPKVCPVCEAVYPDANVFCPVDGSTLHVVDVDGGLVGSVVADRYLVTDLLGEGGMGKVYLARHVRLPQQAAIKVLRPDMVRDPAAVARFNREASNASRIDHENVARVYDFGEANGTVYLAMEFCPGQTLREVILKEGPLAPRRTAELIEQIARGLDAAHRLKIIHRDLKPDNVIIVQGQDGHERAKVVDFGIAKAFGAGDGQLTKTGFVVGTPEFMSPEQLMGSQLDERSDVYALALVAYQCLTMALPFGGDTPESKMTARLMATPKPLSDVTGKAWPAAVQGVFDAALSREVEGRPATAGEFARQLKAAIGGGDLAAPASAKPAKGGAAASTAPGASSGKSAPHGASAEAPRAKGRGGLVIAAVLLLAVGGGAAYKFLLAPAAVGNEGTAAAPDTSSAPSTLAVTPPSTPSPAPSQAAPDSNPVSPPVAAPVTPPSPGAQTAQNAQTAPAVKQAPPAAAPGDTRRPAAAGDSAAAPATARPPAAPSEDPAVVAELDELSTSLKRGVDDAAARRIAGSLRGITIRAVDPATKARAYFRLIDASALSGDLNAACAALRGARGVARSPSQLSELRRYEEQLGCS